MNRDSEGEAKRPTIKQQAFQAEMNEGPEAYERFRSAMKTIIAVPKSSVLPKPKSQKKKRTKT